MMSKVYFRGTRAQARRLAFRLVLMLTGRESDSLNIAKGVLLTLGFAALSDIKSDFVTKSRGGTGEDGVKWQPLKPETIARRRVGPRDIKSDPGIKERESIRKAAYRKYLKRLSVSMSPEMARARAKQLAGMEATRRTGRTKVQTLGSRQVEILRDTGVLLNSLSPGELVGSGPSTIHIPDRAASDQVFDVLDAGVIVGTNVLYSATHQYGDMTRNVPARPFLPETPPDAWEQRWLDAGLEAVASGARKLYEVG